ELDAKSRATQQEADTLRAERKQLSKQIGALMGKGEKDKAEEVKAQVNAQAARLEELEKLEKFWIQKSPAVTTAPERSLKAGKI
nr:hypothetical protein [Synergistaceae bacterium]